MSEFLPRTARDPRPVVLYLITDDRGACKLGVTRHPSRRLSTLRSGYPYPLELVAVWDFPSRERAETAEARLLLQAGVQGLRLNGEWIAMQPAPALRFIEILLDREGRALRPGDYGR